MVCETMHLELARKELNYRVQRDSVGETTPVLLMLGDSSSLMIPALEMLFCSLDSDFKIKGDKSITESGEVCDADDGKSSSGAPPRRKSKRMEKNEGESPEGPHPGGNGEDHDDDDKDKDRRRKSGHKSYMGAQSVENEEGDEDETMEVQEGLDPTGSRFNIPRTEEEIARYEEEQHQLQRELQLQEAAARAEEEAREERRREERRAREAAVPPQPPIANVLPNPDPMAVPSPLPETSGSPAEPRCASTDVESNPSRSESTSRTESPDTEASENRDSPAFLDSGLQEGRRSKSKSPRRDADDKFMLS